MLQLTEQRLFLFSVYFYVYYGHYICIYLYIFIINKNFLNNNNNKFYYKPNFFINCTIINIINIFYYITICNNNNIHSIPTISINKYCTYMHMCVRMYMCFMRSRYTYTSKILKIFFHYCIIIIINTTFIFCCYVLYMYFSVFSF